MERFMNLCVGIICFISACETSIKVRVAGLGYIYILKKTTLLISTTTCLAYLIKEGVNILQRGTIGEFKSLREFLPAGKQLGLVRSANETLVRLMC